MSEDYIFLDLKVLQGGVIVVGGWIVERRLRFGFKRIGEQIEEKVMCLGERRLRYGNGLNYSGVSELER